MPKKSSSAKKKKRSKSKKKQEIQLNFISSDALATKSPDEKRQLILDKIRDNIIVVLEEALDPKEEADLIKTTMEEINSKDFFGIEFYRMDSQKQSVLERVGKFFSERGIKGVEKYIPKSRRGLTIVGPSRVVEGIKKESGYVSMLAKIGD
ncbi:MAG: DUF2073 domain-containing protein [Candidatus Hydrothermarchaeales archaeon]